MSISLNGNGHGNETNTTARPAPKKAAPPAPPAPVGGEGQVAFRTSGAELRGTPVRMTRLATVFELYNPSVTPRMSESLDDFKIYFQERTIYSGRAVICKILDAGSKIICEATLDESHWTDLNIESLAGHGKIAGEFQKFILEWQKLYKVLPEFKVVVADMQTLLHDLQLWLEQLELGLRAVPMPERRDLEQDILKQVGELFVPSFDALHERYENISEQVPEELRPVHRAFSQRQLHPLTLCSPFAHRAYAKPLGYAGDYEMVNMIALNPYQGETLFAKVVNLWFLSQWPSKAHRNRLTYLKERLENETWRVARTKRTARIFNFACGPAIEIQHFLADFRGCEMAEITVADFNENTLNYLRNATNSIKDRLGLRTQIQFQRKSVNHIIKDNAAAARRGKKPEYDFIYCAGLFDYLPDATCRQLMEIFYEWLAPDGLLATTNVNCDKPFRHMLEFVLDWHLIYRNEIEMRGISPPLADEEDVRVLTDSTGVNLFLEVRKPKDA